METGFRPNSAGIPDTLLLRFEVIGFPTFWLLLYNRGFKRVPSEGNSLLAGLPGFCKGCARVPLKRRIGAIINLWVLQEIRLDSCQVLGFTASGFEGFGL